MWYIELFLCGGHTQCFSGLTSDSAFRLNFGRAQGTFCDARIKHKQAKCARQVPCPLYYPCPDIVSFLTDIYKITLCHHKVSKFSYLCTFHLLFFFCLIYLILIGLITPFFDFQVSTGSVSLSDYCLQFVSVLLIKKLCDLSQYRS